MTDEPIQISVTDTGTDDVAAKLVALGASGEQAANIISAGFAKINEGASVTAARFAMIQAAMSSGLGTEAVAALVVEINGLSAAQIKAAGAAGTLATATATAGAAVGGLGVAANTAATGLTRAAGAATGAAAAANTAAAGAAKSGAAAKAAAVSFTEFGKGLGLIAGLVTFSVFEKSADTFTRISNQLAQVTASAADADVQFQKLLATANATQTPIEGTTKLFYNMALALKNASDASDGFVHVTTHGTEIVKDATASMENMQKAVAVIDMALQQSGASTVQVTRTNFELSEAFAKGALQGKQMLTVLMNAPLVMKYFKDGQKELGLQTDKLTASQVAGTKAVTDVTAAREKAQIVYSTEELNIRRLSEAQSNASIAERKLVASGKATQADYVKYTQTSADRRTQIQIAQQQLALDKSTTFTQKLGKQTVDVEAGVNNLIDSFAASYDNATAAQEKIQHTISGSFTILNNDLIAYIAKIDEATGANKVIADSIVLVASNLKTIVPLVAAFAAAWILNQAITSVKALAIELGALRTIIVGIDIASILNPWTIGFGLVAAAILLVYNQTGDLGKTFDVVKQTAIDLWTAVSDGAKEGLAVLAPIYDFVKNTLTFAFNDLSAVITSIFGKAGNVTDNYGQHLTTMQLLIKSIVVTVGVLAAAIATGFAAAVIAVSAFIDVIKQIVTWIVNIHDAFTGWINDFLNGINKSIDAVKSLLGLQSQASTPTPAPQVPIAGARNGADFHVTGNGGTDSQLVQFMATPGERVIVQTPSQVANDHLPHFATGGSLAVTGGLAGVQVAFIQSAASGVTGYTPAAIQAVQALPPTPAPSNDNGGSVGSGGSTSGGAGDIVSQIMSALSIYSQTPLAFGRSVSALGYLNNNALDTQYVPTWLAKTLGHGSDATIYYKADKPSDINLSQPWGAHVTSDLETQYLNDAIYLASILNTVLPTSGYGVGGQIGSNTAPILEKFRITNEMNKLIAQGALSLDHDPIERAIVNATPGASIGFSSSGGTNPADFGGWNPNYDHTGLRPSDPGYAALMKQNITTTNPYVIGSPAWEANMQKQYPNNDPTSGVWSGGQVPSGAQLFFRDGGDFTIPGAGGVDTRTLQMLVSPGEHVSIKRPQDQPKREYSLGGTTVVNMSVIANDVDSFRRSDQQIDMALQRRLTKIARRVRY